MRDRAFGEAAHELVIRREGCNLGKSRPGPWKLRPPESKYGIPVSISHIPLHPPSVLVRQLDGWCVIELLATAEMMLITVECGGVPTLGGGKTIILVVCDGISGREHDTAATPNLVCFPT